MVRRNKTHAKQAGDLGCSYGNPSPCNNDNTEHILGLALEIQQRKKLHKDRHSKSPCEHHRQMTRSLWSVRFALFRTSKCSVKPALNRVSFTMDRGSETPFSNSNDNGSPKCCSDEVSGKGVSDGGKCKITKASNESPSKKKGCDCTASLTLAPAVLDWRIRLEDSLVGVINKLLRRRHL